MDTTGRNLSLWKNWIGETVYIRLANGRNYQGKVLSVDSPDLIIIYLTLLTKEKRRLLFTTHEIKVIQKLMERSQ